MDMENEFLREQKRISYNSFTKIGVKNFGQFKDKVEFDLKSITILTGPNNSGKSTLNKLLTFMSACFELKYDEGMQDLYLGSLNQIKLNKLQQKRFGTIKDNLNRNSVSNEIEFYFTYPHSSSQEETTLTLVYRVNDKNSNVAYLTKYVVSVEGVDIINLTKKDVFKYYNNDIYIYEVRYNGTINTHVVFLPEKHIGNNRDIWLSNIKNIDKGLLHKYVLLGDSSDVIMRAFSKDGNDNAEVIFSTDFRNDILNTENFFSENSFFKDELKIDNIEEFNKKYVDFEESILEIIYSNYYNNLSSVRTTSLDELKAEYSKEYPKAILPSVDADYQVVKRKSFDEIFISKNRLQNLSYESIIDIINSIDNPLSELFINELKSLSDKAISEEDIEKSFNIESFNNVRAKLLSSIIPDLTGHNYGNGFKSIFINQIHRKGEVFRQHNSIPTMFLFEESDSYPSHFSLLNNDQRNTINNWLKDFGIADEIIVSEIKEGENILGFSYKLKKGDYINHLTNEGYGVQKLVSIFIYLSVSESDYYSLIIEEPEANLHPAWQSKLAEVFTEVSLNKSIIIETHSEYLIRKFQNIIAYNHNNKPRISLENKDTWFEELRKWNRDSLFSNHVSIYYLNNDKDVNEREPKIKKIEITKTGGLSDTFGTGFFDETSNLQFEILQLKKDQFN